MKKRMIILFKILISTVILFNLTGCWNANELNTLPIVVGIGIDKAPSDEEVQVVAQIIKPQELQGSLGSSDGGGEAYWNLTSTGETIFDAIREMTHESSGRLYTAHNQIIVIGNKIASEGVQKYLDFFMRAHETRPNTLIVISSNTSTEILDTKPELTRIPAESITRLSEAQEIQSHSKKVTFQDFTNYLMSKTTSPVAPLITSLKDKETSTLKIEGMAIFKGDQMVGQLDESESRGLLWVTGDIKTGALVVPYKNEVVTLEIINAKRKITPKIQGDNIYIHVEIKEEGKIVEQTSKENLATLQDFEELKKVQNEAIKSEILSALNKAQELNTDIFGFGEEIHKKYKEEWKEISSNWDKIFPSIEVEIEIQSSIDSTGKISHPAVPQSLE
ncbi:Ger(x)C family spore germination protein [Alkalibaculum sp. M08DMB]|uniref:Ger(X)C family spore germination protein n=1 Tax=Alkalibaculum sporogenes TaxID=2655001 RepID=A0A6A7K7I1_9FIRM|nr:Ger(x)C family spore germination protein [Alkalibaculum sporogenes]MPW25468.1 Ger(x)C family spore germination protein [Alkalibaculum sporogenes]